MARRALSASLVLTPFAVALAMQGCTQDFSTFDPTGAGGSDTPTTTSGQTTTTTTGPTTVTTGPGGGEGGSTTTSGPGGGGGGTPCEQPSQCDDEEPCTTDTCDDGFCSNTPIDDGSVEPGYEDDPADCQIRLCQGGTAVDAADDDDDPEDEACREVVCENGAPAPGDAINEGETCGTAPLECVEGVCVGCNADNQCPDPVEACLVAECNDDGTCGSTPTDVDPVDDDGDDCRMPTCDGVRPTPVFVADATDTPPNDVCGIGACNDMTPVQNAAPAGTACAQDGAVCDGSASGAAACVVCTVDGRGTTFGCSGETPVCDEAANGGEGMCVGCLADDDCVAGVCDTGSNTCVECLIDDDCEGTDICDPATDTCVGCITDDDCTDQVCDPDTDTCEDCYSDGMPGTDPGCASDDDLDPVCNEATRTCGDCTADTDCEGNPRGDDCRSFAGDFQCGCQNAANDCEAGESCSSNVCN